MAVSSYGSGGRGYNPLDYYKQQLMPLSSLSDYTKDKTLNDTSTSSADALAGATGQMNGLSIGALPIVPEEGEAEAPQLAPSPPASSPPKNNDALNALTTYGPLAVLAGAKPAAIAAGAVATGRGLHEAKDTWDQGHGAQQTAIGQVMNPTATGINAMLGEPLSPSQQGLAQGMFVDPTGFTTLAAEVLPNFFSGKSKEQAQRDRIRSQMQDFGLLDDKYQYKLPDGSTFDFGADGGARLPNGMHYSEVNPEDPFHVRVVEMAKPLGAILSGGDPGQTQSMSAYIANMAMSNQNTYEGVKQNIVDFASKLRMSPQQVKDQLSAWKDEGRISEEELNRYVSVLQNDLMEGGNGTYEPPQPATPTPAPVENPRLKSLPPVQRSTYWQAATNKPAGLLGAQAKPNGSAIPAGPSTRATSQNPRAK